MEQYGLEFPEKVNKGKSAYVPKKTEEYLVKGKIRI
jgi:hypothetical protein